MAPRLQVGSPWEGRSRVGYWQNRSYKQRRKLGGGGVEVITERGRKDISPTLETEKFQSKSICFRVIKEVPCSLCEMSRRDPSRYVLLSKK